MSVKSIDHLNQILEELTKSTEWAQVNSEAKQNLLNDIHEQLAEDMLYGEIKKSTKKTSRRSRKKADQTDNDGGDGSQSA